MQVLYKYVGYPFIYQQLMSVEWFYMADKNVNFISTSETGSKSWKKNLGLK